jgi:hypothetical protein
MRASVAASLLSFLALGGAACAGDSSEEKTFHGDGFSFTYPGGWHQGDYPNENPDVIPAAAAITYSDEPTTDSVSVTVVPDQVEVTADNVDDSVADIANTATAGYGKLDSGPTVVTVGGLPAMRLEASALSDGTPLLYRTELVFDGTTWYAIQCEFRQESAEKIRPGCDQAMESFRVE